MMPVQFNEQSTMHANARYALPEYFVKKERAIEF